MMLPRAVIGLLGIVPNEFGLSGQPGLISTSALYVLRIRNASCPMECRSLLRSITYERRFQVNRASRMQTCCYKYDVSRASLQMLKIQPSCSISPLLLGANGDSILVLNLARSMPHLIIWQFIELSVSLILELRVFLLRKAWFHRRARCTRIWYRYHSVPQTRSAYTALL